MGTDNLIFLEVIEWHDTTGREMVHRIPEQGSGEIKWGAQLIIRESQAGVFFYNGRACDVFGPGRHTLKTANIPMLTKLLAAPWGATSPLRAEVYFVGMQVFTDLKWGTRDPVAFKDAELGLIRLRAHGVFNVQVVQPLLLINTLVGTIGKFDTEAIEEYLKEVIVSRFNDLLGEQLDSLFSLPGRYDELSTSLRDRLREDLSHFGLGLRQLYITSITPPPEVQKTIDDRSRLSVIEDLDSLIKLKAAAAMEKAAETGGEAGAGLGMGMGFMMPAMFADSLRPHSATAVDSQAGHCQGCNRPVHAEDRFCAFCGHQQLVFTQCAHCGENLLPFARFCPRCGHPAAEKPIPTACPHCKAVNLPNASFCNQCGEKIG
ncbi:MAG: virion core protein (lumpy skin disease virus) [Deltaproteobacteria bacterium CG_4_10_14_3_um_filter_60_8]|nr:MAG: virion core protein (lumpy skin disease virus) [Deltaproteobacteria bacterium CG_4_10_14_3_um_filter_60_8]